MVIFLRSFIFSLLLEYVFTTLGGSGHEGPKDTTGYDGTLLAGKVTLSDGIQLWTVPQTGNYIIEAFGASGANGTCLEGNCTGKDWRLGGLGAVMKGAFDLKKGTKLKILVGQEGSRTVTFGTRAGGGGGGTFVVRDDNTPLIIAGGGGGGAQPKSERYLDGGPGLVSENGGVCGGSGGSGGLQCDGTGNSASLAGGAGAGLNTNGAGFFGKPGSFSFINGGKGGVGPYLDIQGGFGGGGFGLESPGGGGGYSGGGIMGSSNSGQAGGGGSYNNGTNPSNKTGANKGHGKVIVTYQ